MCSLCFECWTRISTWRILTKDKAYRQIHSIWKSVVMLHNRSEKQIRSFWNWVFTLKSKMYRVLCSSKLVFVKFIMGNTTFPLYFLYQKKVQKKIVEYLITPSHHQKQLHCFSGLPLEFCCRVQKLACSHIMGKEFK